MNKLAAAILGTALAFTGAAHAQQQHSTAHGGGPAPAANPWPLVASPDFGWLGPIPRLHTAAGQGCPGQNVPITLSWSNIPPGTRSLALTMVDYTAPVSPAFVHWIAYNIPPTWRGINPATLRQVSQGKNDAGTVGYYGPCPPAGPAHVYTITLYPLDTMLHPPQPLTFAQFQNRIQGHIVKPPSVPVGLVGRLVGTFKAP